MNIKKVQKKVQSQQILEFVQPVCIDFMPSTKYYLHSNTIMATCLTYDILTIIICSSCDLYIVCCVLEGFPPVKAF